MDHTDTPTDESAHRTMPAALRLIGDVMRYLVQLAVDAVRDLVRIPVVAIKAVAGLLSANGRPTRLLLVRLLIDSARELLLIPVTLGAAAIDLLLTPLTAPFLFYALRRFERRCESLLDHWFDAALVARPKYVVAVLALTGITEAITDPERSERRARAVRWRALRRQAQRDSNA